MALQKTSISGKAGAGHTHLFDNTGQTGPAGQTGSAGAAGATGAAGPNVTILTHTGIPTSSDGPFTKGQCAMDTNNTFYVCTVSGTPGSWTYLALTYAAGTISLDVSLGVNSLTPIFNTASLAVGVWDLTVFAVGDTGALGAIEIEVVEGAAAATFVGPTSSGGYNVGAASYNEVPMGFGCIAIVTSAGALKVQGEGDNGTSSTIKAATPVYGFPGATGYKAVRIG